jgi:NAD(P)-dependent dehydrogenase (short-subunit alcohol dehydrogenase family)
MRINVREYGFFRATLAGPSNQSVPNRWEPRGPRFLAHIERGMPDLYKTAMSLNPTGRMGTPQEVAAGVVFLASPVASRISGTNLIVDGALTKAV